jgi:hypothetical protein
LVHGIGAYNHDSWLRIDIFANRAYMFSHWSSSMSVEPPPSGATGDATTEADEAYQVSFSKVSR